MSKEILEALLERLQNTNSIEELQVWTHELRDYFGVAHIFYHTANLKGEQVGAFTYSIDWVRHYIQKDYRAVDPVVVGAIRRHHPMDWKTLDWSSPQSREFNRDALEHGVGNQGWSVPLWGPNGEFALFALNDTCSDEVWSKFTRENAKQILMVSHLVHQQAMLIINNQLDAPSTELSPREREALAQLSMGQSRAKVANALRISENTLRAYIDSARHKLGAANVTHAVAIAMSKGIIVSNGALPKY